MDHQKFTGYIEEISPAAGSEFSMIRPDNAKGNFTKVLQHIVVRITIDPNQKDLEHLSPGMFVETKALTSTRH